MKIGDTVWFFDGNHRVYPKDSRFGSGPIYREHWRSAKIIGETSRSWITDHWARKIPKKGPTPNGVAMSVEDVERDVWLNVHLWRVREAVGRVRDYETIRKIAELVGYKEDT